MTTQQNTKSNNKMITLLGGLAVLAIALIYFVIGNPNTNENVAGTMGGKEKISNSNFASKITSEKKYRVIEENLLQGINSDNRGVQVSSAYFLGEIKSERAVNSLLKMLKSGSTEEERIIAALSLSKIGSEKAIFAVKQRIKFDDSKRVQRLCEVFYNYNQVEGIHVEKVTEPSYVVDLNMGYKGIRLSEFASN